MMKASGWKVAVFALAIGLTGWVTAGNHTSNVVSAEAAMTTTVGGGGVNTVTVGGDGSIKVDPDVAFVNVAIETKASTASAAQQANAKLLVPVEKTLYDQFGIDKKDVRMTGFNVQPEYNFTDKGGRVLLGYIATHQLQITYRQLDNIGKLLDALTAAGVNRMDGVSFGTEKADQYELEALKKAMANADAKASVLATSAKHTLGGVLNIVQGVVNNNPIPFAPMAKSMLSSDSSASTSVQPGQIEINTSVTVQYALQ